MKHLEGSLWEIRMKGRDGISRALYVVARPRRVSELLVHAGEATNQYLDVLNGQAVFRIAPFDQKAAIEAAIAMGEAISRGGIRVDATDPDATRGKVKFDRQIVAIAKAEGASAVYSDDGDVVKYAGQAGLKAYRTIDLDLPPEDPQTKMDL